MLLMVVATACANGEPRESANPSVESYTWTNRSGQELGDEEYAAFYGRAVEAAGATRDRLSVDIGLGDRGTTITVVRVAGADAGLIRPALLDAAFPGTRFLAVLIDGIQTLRPHAGGGRSVAVMSDGDAVVVVDAVTESLLAQALPVAATAVSNWR